jgi:hypothetical protein
MEYLYFKRVCIIYFCLIMKRIIISITRIISMNGWLWNVDWLCTGISLYIFSSSTPTYSSWLSKISGSLSGSTSLACSSGSKSAAACGFLAAAALVPLHPLPLDFQDHHYLVHSRR